MKKHTHTHWVTEVFYAKCQRKKKTFLSSMVGGTYIIKNIYTTKGIWLKKSKYKIYQEKKEEFS